MQERDPFARLGVHEEFLQKRASRLSDGDPMLAEDLAQEARIAVFTHLRQEPDCPDSHLVLTAKDAIYEYRRRGSSVDGKLNEVRRSRRYRIVSLQDPLPPNGQQRIETTADPRQPERVTEEIACTNVIFDCFRDRLSSRERQALDLRVRGSSWRQITNELQCDPYEMHQMRASIEQEALAIWEQSNSAGSTTRVKIHPSSVSRPACIHAWVQGDREITQPRLPELPPAILATLGEAARQALSAYQEGATQTEAAEQAGLSQSTVSRLIRFVREASGKLPEGIAPTRHYKSNNRRESFFALFNSRPLGQAVTHEEMLALFSDVKDPSDTIRVSVARYNQQLKGRKILCTEQGYLLVEEQTQQTDADTSRLLA